jgi:putative restriction endonuclease
MINYFNEIANIKVHRTGNVISLHKPLLLLLTIADTINGHANTFLFKDVEQPLKDLLAKYGLKNTKQYRPDYPFVYLSSSPAIWKCSLDKDNLNNPRSVTRAKTIDSYAKFESGFYAFLKREDHAKRIVMQLLSEYWPEAYHEDILRDIGLLGSMQEYLSIEQQKQKRGRLFVEEVLDNYERQCAICKQSIRLGDSLIGIDACHIKPIQHYGADNITNGIALCKMHHWALDRGAISISDDFELLISPKLNGSRINELFYDFLRNEIFLPRNLSNRPEKENLGYHRKYIFIE